MAFDNGDTYDGEWKNNHKFGKGMFTFNNHESYKSYEGSFIDDQFEGQGKLIFNNGQIYEGGFQKGLQDGEGKLTEFEGFISEGRWLKGHKDAKITVKKIQNDFKLQSEKTVVFDLNNNEKQNNSSDAEVTCQNGVWEFNNNFIIFEDCQDVPDSNFQVSITFKTQELTFDLFCINDNVRNGHDRHLYFKEGVPYHGAWKGGMWKGDLQGITINDGQWLTWNYNVIDGLGQDSYIDDQLIGHFQYDHSDFDWKNQIIVGYSQEQKAKFKGQIKHLYIYKFNNEYIKSTKDKENSQYYDQLLYYEEFWQEYHLAKRHFYFKDNLQTDGLLDSNGFMPSIDDIVQLQKNGKNIEIILKTVKNKFQLKKQLLENEYGQQIIQKYPQFFYSKFNPNKIYKIILDDDIPFISKGKNWGLCAHKYFDKDLYSTTQIKAMVHEWGSQAYKITPSNLEESYTISSLEQDSCGFNQVGFCLYPNFNDLRGNNVKNIRAMIQKDNCQDISWVIQQSDQNTYNIGFMDKENKIWYMAAHATAEGDFRDTASYYVNLNRDNLQWPGKNWRIEEAN